MVQGSPSCCAPSFPAPLAPRFAKILLHSLPANTEPPAESVIDNARQAEKVHPGRPIAIALDTKGPEIRTGNTKNDEDIPISVGTILNITTDEKYKDECTIEHM